MRLGHVGRVVVAVNCAAIRALARDELFATKRRFTVRWLRPWSLSAADGGTLFSMKSETSLSNCNQTSRVLQESRWSAWAAVAHYKSMYGSSQQQPELWRMVQERSSSRSLLRLNVFDTLPPLRERRCDIHAAEHFVQSSPSSNAVNQMRPMM